MTTSPGHRVWPSGTRWTPRRTTPVKPPIMTFVPNGASRLAVRQWEATGAPILALHAGVADSRVWECCAGTWADAGHRVVGYDRRGFGSTTWEEEPHDPLADLRAVTRATSCRPAVVVGNSMGGALGLELAIAHPDEVLALIVIGSAPEDTRDDLWVLAPTEEQRDAEGVAAAASGDLDPVNRLDLRYRLDGIGQPEGRVIGAPRELLATMNGAALRALPTGDVTPARPVWNALESLSVPVLFVAGEHDLPGFAVVAAAMTERVPDAHLVTSTVHRPPPAARRSGRARRPGARCSREALLLIAHALLTDPHVAEVPVRRCGHQVVHPGPDTVKVIGRWDPGALSLSGRATAKRWGAAKSTGERGVSSADQVCLEATGRDRGHRPTYPVVLISWTETDLDGAGPAG